MNTRQNTQLVNDKHDKHHGNDKHQGKKQISEILLGRQ